MQYEGTVYRPPSEAYSLIIQVTIGCSYNQCSFCSMYKDKKFRIRRLEEVLDELEEARRHYREVKRIFLADGDAMICKAAYLKEVLVKIKNLFPECERVGIYSSPQSIMNKTIEELSELRKLGLGIAYLGIESGSDKILKYIQKGTTAEEMILAGRKILTSGIKLSATLISGLGGKEHWQEHAIESARIVNAIQPQYLGLLTLLLEPGVSLEAQVKNGEFQLLTPIEILKETKMLLENFALNHCIFRSNHASNYISLQGTLPEDRQRLIQQLDEAIEQKDDYNEYFRRL
ncbi:radical SAM protein [Geosporobacter ferrireducens]|uniref:Radical SAM protein n=1 Tax=Geosporobacter ferrireducens TaxID=1424294 RepID=A0A1D8GD03_9FIRM|nr:radical SAM protein [Geosporobacter ferrireducens]AOT68798.1 radical SAM protein [Geosporobacter ferrireducens]